jgi:DNA-binding CsgD family transcriptional regulator
VSNSVIGRSVEFSALTKFLQSAGVQPSALVIEGEAGIGKTTLWLAAVERAREHGFRVLSARVGQNETVLAYAALADLLGGVDAAVLTRLPGVQRIAVDRVLLRATSEGPATDQRVVAAALVSVAHALAAETPVLVAIDDVQWLDASSQAVVAFAARRFNRRVGVLVTERVDAGNGNASWLQLARPEAVDRIRVGPLSIGDLHTLISTRLGKSLSRPTMVRIAEVSGGNPFYALEFARAMDAVSTSADSVLPAALAELMHMRIGRLDQQAHDVLLAAAWVANPTVELLAAATNSTVDRIVELLDEPESNGVVVIEGNRVRFAHPLLARSVFTEARPARRRAIHRSLANALALPELKARHTALGAASADPETLHALDTAAAAARTRGAPAAAAELVELAIGLGGDKPSRRIRAAEHHFKAGDADRARALLESSIDHMRPGPLRSIALNLLAGIRMYDDAFVEAATLLKRALDDAERNPAVLVQTLMSLAFAQGIAGELDDSLRNARQAVKHAEELANPELISRALALLAATTFLGGQVDEASLQRALALENPDADILIPFCASAVHALVVTWAGRLDEARTVMQSVRLRCIEHGAEVDLMAVTGYCTLIEMWRGNFAEAAQLAQDTIEQAEQVGGSRAFALTVRATVAAYTGREDDARADAAAALTIARQCGSPRLAEWPSMSLGFLEVSLGRYAEALSTFQPLLENLDAMPRTQITTAMYIPDAVEAMIALGRDADAERLIEDLEHIADRLGRSWMVAVGARCRSMWLAAQGDVAAAHRIAHDAMTEHERLPMPFERARTQLWLGQLLRRQRQRDAARATFREALEAFDAMGTPLWADRVRAELARVKVAPTRNLTLTSSERRVAELAASGMTNRDIAAALFVSPKTVEVNLARVYRKLGIRTRAELGRHIGADSDH